MSFLSRLCFSTSIYRSIMQWNHDHCLVRRRLTYQNQKQSYFKAVSRDVAFKYLNEKNEDISLLHPASNTIASAPIQQQRVYPQQIRRPLHEWRKYKLCTDQLTLQALQLHSNYI